MYPVITISREFGSGGHSIGKQVAEKLDIPFYDSEIVNRVALESGYAKELIETHGEYANPHAMWFDVNAAGTMYYQSPQDEIFIAQKKVILECAQSGPCVIVGRCGDYILHKEGIRTLTVMIHADMESRKKRVLERYENIENVSIEKRLAKKDKQRKTYYRYYTDREWGDFREYDLMLDSSTLGEELCVQTICDVAGKYPQ